MKNITSILIFIHSISIAQPVDIPINPSVLPSACCAYPQFQNPRLLQWCRRKYENNGMSVISEECAHECFFNTSRIWRNEQPVKSAVMTAFTRFIPTQWRRLLVWTINYCLPKYESRPPTTPNPLLRMMVIADSNCNEGPVNFVTCIGEQILRNCPAQKFRATPDCRRKRQIIAQNS